MAANYECVTEKFGIEKLSDNQELALKELAKGKDEFLPIFVPQRTHNLMVEAMFIVSKQSELCPLA